MALIGDFVAGAGAVGAQMSMDALKSTIEEERAARLAEMQNKFQTARDNADRGFRTSERVAGQEHQVTRDVAERGFRSAEAEKADARATDRMYVGASIAEEADVNRFEREQPNKEREFAQRDRQIGISGGANSLARERFQWEKEQAEAGKAPTTLNDGTIGYAKIVKGADGQMTREFLPLKDKDGNVVRGPKNLSESNKIIYGAQAKIAAEGSNPEAAKEATAIMRAIEMNPSVDFGAIKLAEPGGAKAGPSKGDAEYKDMQKRGEKAGPMNAPAPKAPVTGNDPEPPKYRNRGQLSPEWEAWKERQDEKAAQARGAEIRAVRSIVNP